MNSSNLLITCQPTLWTLGLPPFLSIPPKSLDLDQCHNFQHFPIENIWAKGLFDEWCVGCLKLQQDIDESDREKKEKRYIDLKPQRSIDNE